VEEIVVEEEERGFLPEATEVAVAGLEFSKGKAHSPNSNFNSNNLGAPEAPVVMVARVIAPEEEEVATAPEVVVGVM
jgi:hypothetical protein